MSHERLAGAARAVAITRAVPTSLPHCELTYQTRVPIDLELARAQHAAYRDALVRHGYHVVELPEAPDLPDSVFVEDVAVIFDELAVITRPGAPSRRPEVPSVSAALQEYRTVHEITAPGTLDGGDVLQLGRRVFVGVSTRTNHEGIAQLARIVERFGYQVIPVDVDKSLHLKSLVTAVADDLIVADTDSIDPAIFDVRCIAVPPEAANMLRLKNVVLCPAAAAAVAQRLTSEGLAVELLDNSELAKAEGALTCCSLIIEG